MNSQTFVLMGATGDLSKKKLIPSLYRLLKNKNLKDFAVVGVALEKVQKKSILEKAKKYIKKIDKKTWEEFSSRFYYFQADFSDLMRFKKLDSYIFYIEEKHRLSGNRIFYLATLPEHFKSIAYNLKKCKVARDNRSKVVFEKPFGENLKTAKDMNKCIRSVFSEKQIYRIDHYLGKELIQNIAVMRFTNTILEPIWNRKYIDHVQIILSEDIGIEERGKFYDHYGVLKDVVQNHAMQMLTLASMESPKRLVGDCIRDEKVKILKKLKIKKSVLGQYIGYKSEKGIKRGSNTETFAAIKCQINNKRWKKVPFYIVAGKNMKSKLSTIYVQFKQAPCLMFKGMCNFVPNHLVIQVQPKEGFYIIMNAKVPGKTQIKSVKMDFCHACAFGPNTPEAYENLFLDIIKGDQSSFIRSDEIELAWKKIDKIKRKKVFAYKPKEIPEPAKKLIQKDKRNWHLHID